MYPSIEPYDSGHLEVGDGHAVYWEVVGSSGGMAARRPWCPGLARQPAELRSRPVPGGHLRSEGLRP